jgi:hypothetical protein
MEGRCGKTMLDANGFTRLVTGQTMTNRLAT